MALQITENSLQALLKDINFLIAELCKRRLNQEINQISGSLGPPRSDSLLNILLKFDRQQISVFDLLSLRAKCIDYSELAFGLEIDRVIEKMIQLESNLFIANQDNMWVSIIQSWNQAKQTSLQIKCSEPLSKKQIRFLKLVEIF